MRVLKALGQAVGVDADDAKVLATITVALVAVGVGLVILGGFIGLAVAAFGLASGAF